MNCWNGRSTRSMSGESVIGEGLVTPVE